MWKHTLERLEKAKKDYPHLSQYLLSLIIKRKKAMNAVQKDDIGEKMNLVFYKGQVDFIDSIKKSPYELTGMDLRLTDIDKISYNFNFVIRYKTTNYLVIFKIGKCINDKVTDKWEEINFMSQYIENPIIVIVNEKIDVNPLNKTYNYLNFCYKLPEPFATDRNVLVAQSYMGQCCSHEASDEEFNDFVTRLDSFDTAFACKKNYMEFDKRLSFHFVPEVEKKRWEIMKKKLTPFERPQFIKNSFPKQLGEAFFISADVYTEHDHFTKDEQFNALVRVVHTSEKSYSLFRKVRKDKHKCRIFKLVSSELIDS